MRCECGRWSIDPVCPYCLTERRRVNALLGKSRRSKYAIPTIERSGLRCSCGEPSPMVAEVYRWTGSVVMGWSGRVAPGLSAERLLWYRCVGCGSITRETLIPASL